MLSKLSAEETGRLDALYHLPAGACRLISIYTVTNLIKSNALGRVSGTPITSSILRCKIFLCLELLLQCFVVSSCD